MRDLPVIASLVRKKQNSTRLSNAEETSHMDCVNNLEEDYNGLSIARLICMIVARMRTVEDLEKLNGRPTDQWLPNFNCLAISGFNGYEVATLENQKRFLVQEFSAAVYGRVVEPLVSLPQPSWPFTFQQNALLLGYAFFLPGSLQPFQRHDETRTSALLEMPMFSNVSYSLLAG